MHIETDINTEKEALFKRAYFMYFDRIHYFALCYLHNDAEAENIAQDVYLSLWEKMDEFGLSDDFLPILYLMAKWKCLNVLRRKRRNEVFIDRKICDELSTIALMDSSSTTLYFKEVDNLYERALKTMPEKVRETFLLSRNENLKYREIAEKLSVSEKTIEHRVSCAFTVLRKFLKDYIKILLLWI